MSCKLLFNRLLYGSTTMTKIEKTILLLKDECVVCFWRFFLIIIFTWINFVVGLFCLLKRGIKKMSNFRYKVKHIFSYYHWLKACWKKIVSSSYYAQIMHSSMVFKITCISYYMYLLKEKYISKRRYR